MDLQMITEKYLKENGFDGLVSPRHECACKIGELMPCDTPNPTCVPGYLAPCSDETCGEEHAFHITEKKEEGAGEGA